MPISPEKGMRGKKAWRYAQFSHAGDLIFTRHLRVNKEGPSIRPGIFFTCSLYRIENVLYRRIAVAVYSNLNPLFIETLNLLKQRFSEYRGIASIFLIAFVGVVIGLTQISRETLNTAVRNDFHPRHHDATALKLIEGHFTANQLLTHLIEPREQRNSNRYLVVFGHRAQQACQCFGHPPRGCCRHTMLQVFGGRELRHLPHIARREVERLLSSVMCRSLFQYTVWSALIR